MSEHVIAILKKHLTNAMAEANKKRIRKDVEYRKEHPGDGERLEELVVQFAADPGKDLQALWADLFPFDASTGGATESPDGGGE